MRARTGQFAVRAHTGQFAPVAPLRSALHSNRTFTTRGLYFIDRCAGVPVRARTGQFAGVAALRSALHSNRTFITRGRYFIGRCAGVLFPDTLIPSAGYKAALRVQSERSERLRELTPAARRRSERLRELRAQALRPLKRWAKLCASVPRGFCSDRGL